MSNEALKLAERLLEQAERKADSAEVMYQDSESRGVSFQDNQLKSVSGSATRGIGLRVIHKGRIGFSSTTDFEKLDELIAAALDSAAFGQEARFTFPGDPGILPEVKMYDPAVRELEMARAAEILREGIAFIRAASPECQCMGGIGAEWGSTILCNSAGLRHEELSSDYSMSIGGFLARGESFLSVEEGEDGSRVSEDILRHARRVSDWIRFSQREVRLGEETLPVIFTPNALDLLLNTLEMNVNGKMVQKGASMLANRVGEKVLGTEVTLIDDPFADYAAGSTAIDGEGVPSRRNAIFERGVLRGFLFDMQTAGMLGEKSTGSGMRGYSSTPQPGATNWRIAPGDTSYADILRGIRRGLLLDSALGAGQGNVLAGDFSVNVELGFLIENGEIVGRVKDCMLAGNAFEALNRVRAISKETEWHGTLEAPYVCCEGLTVAG